MPLDAAMYWRAVSVIALLARPGSSPGLPRPCIGPPLEPRETRPRDRGVLPGRDLRDFLDAGFLDFRDPAIVWVI